MGSLYSFKQREKADGELFNPLEDFLTEILAACIRSLDGAMRSNFLNALCGGHFSKGELEILASDTVELKTQHIASTYGRPDMVLFAHGVPLCIFENKVAHSISEKYDERSGHMQSQLHKYCEWLVSERSAIHEQLTKDEETSARHTWFAKPQLIFISHFTQPPSDFGDDPSATSCKYYNLQRHNHSWSTVARALLACTNKLHERDYARTLSNNFLEFLKEQDMASEYPEHKSFAALELFLSEGAKLENLMDTMFDAVKHAANLKNNSAHYFEPDFEFGHYSKIHYVKECGIANGWTALRVGIWFPSSGNGWVGESIEDDMKMQGEDMGSFTDGPRIYLAFMNRDDDVFKKIKTRPDGWFRPTSDFMVFKELGSFTGDPVTRAENIVAWLKIEADKLRQFLIENNLTKF